ncbi:MAG: hypothetical protein ACP5QR_16635, partial [Rhizomicrobium sp.]
PRSSRRTRSPARPHYYPKALNSPGLRSMMLVLVLAPLLGLISALLIKWEPVGRSLDITEEISLSTGD